MTRSPPTIGVPMLHIGDATADQLVADGRKRVALLGTRFTMTEPHVRSRLESARHRARPDRAAVDRRGRPDHLRGARRRPRRPRQPAQAEDADHRARQAEGPGGRARLHRAGARGRRPRQRAAGLRHDRDPRPRLRRLDARPRKRQARGRCLTLDSARLAQRLDTSAWIEQGRPSRPTRRRRALQRGAGDLCRARRGAARPRSGRRGDPRGAEDAAARPGRLPHAGCARRRALRRQGAGAEEPGHQLHPGRQAAEAAAADGRADAVDDDRHDPDRGRGAAARSAADQALPARLQRAAARRQKLPVHPAARGS